MGQKEPDPQRRSFFDLLRNPERLGRELGRAYRELNDAINPPSVSAEEYERLREQVAQLEVALQEAVEQQEQDQTLIRQLVLQSVEQDRKLAEILAILQNSELAQDTRQLSRWQALRKRLWIALGSLVSGTAVAEALRDAWVQEELYPLIHTLPERAQEAWTAFIESGQLQAQPPESPLSPLDTPTPESTQPAQLRDALRISFDWVTIPAGEFIMGSDKQRDPKAYNNEIPQHRLYLPEFHISRTPVTVAQFAQFVEAIGYVTTAEAEGWSGGWTGSKWEQIQGAYWRQPRGPDSGVRQKREHPVTCVSWGDAVAFCEWAGVRLPSEAEWEKAARGTDSRIYPWGNVAPTERHCNFNLNVGDTTPVGKYPVGASPYGVLDMAGNVWEWTNSLWGEGWEEPDFGYPYDPTDGRENPQAAGRRVLRGGSFAADEDLVRCAVRNRLNIQYSNFNLGFRVSSPGL